MAAFTEILTSQREEVCGAHIVENGSADLFAVLPSGVRYHIMRIAEGEPLFEIHSGTRDRLSPSVNRLLILPSPGARFTPLKPAAIPSAFDAWRQSLAAATGMDRAAAALHRDAFHHAALNAMQARIAEHEVSSRERLRAKAAAHLEAHAPARQAVWLAWQAVAKAIGVEPPAGAESLKTVPELARAANLRARKCALKGDWWKHDSGPLIAFRSGTAVALLPNRFGGYRLLDPAASRVAPVTRQIALTLDSTAFSFFQPLPTGTLGSAALLWLCVREFRGELARLTVLALLSGILGLLTPFAMKHLLDFSVPSAERIDAALIGGLLALSSVAGALLAYAGGVAMQRVTARGETALSCALWDRLLTLETEFFGRLSPGDLAQRLRNVGEAVQSSVAPLLASGLSLPYALAQAVMMFHYRPDIAARALVLPALLILGSAVASVFMAQRAGQGAAWQGPLSSLVLQSIRGVLKIRAAAAESRIFSSWVRLFRRMRIEFLAARRIGAAHSALHVVAPVLGWALVVLWSGGVESARRGTLWSAGSLIAFGVAFQQVIAAAVQFGTTATKMALMFPAFERLHPILNARAELSSGRACPALTGVIQVENLSFEYQLGNPILRDVSFRVEPGEFVAIVGASGSGKSTLLRLLLGFERAGRGGVYYDGQEIGALDPRSLRRHMGVVLQNGQLLEGDIASNILCSSMLGPDAAWEAARLAGLDAEIERMPMKLHTRVAEGGRGLSGGQRQRLLIARALLHKPRIVFFDEATSALDNHAQAAVTAGLQTLNATRIVIAHRLSTIRNADRILVLAGGTIAESGTYDDLVARRGLFHGLVQLQLT